jgi:hypothetical protein
MPLFTYRCPNTGRSAQGFTAEDVSLDIGTYEVVRCVLCRKIHRVNPATGKMLGEDRKQATPGKQSREPLN